MEGRIRYIEVGIVWVATLTAVLVWFPAGQQTRLAIAVGPRNSVSFRLATAIAAVFNRSNPHSIIDAFKIAGSGEDALLCQ